MNQIQVLLAVTMTEHSEENRHHFERHVALLPEVMECFSVSGDRDGRVAAHLVVDEEAELSGSEPEHGLVVDGNALVLARRLVDHLRNARPARGEIRDHLGA